MFDDRSLEAVRVSDGVVVEEVFLLCPSQQAVDKEWCRLNHKYRPPEYVIKEYSYY